MAKLGSITLPIFTEYNGARIDIGQIEVPISVTIDNRPSAPVMRARLDTTE